MVDFNNKNYEKTVESKGKTYTYYDIEAVAKDFGGDINKLPYSVRVLLESVLRQQDGVNITEAHVKALVNWEETQGKGEYPFKPMRVVLQDLTGTASIVDLASMREAMVQLGKDPLKINPEVPVDMVIDHSVQVDYFGSDDSLDKNMALEFERNDERYKFAKWAQKTFDNFRVVPPATGIIHQVNMEYLSDVVMDIEKDGKLVACPDTLVGTDSHTTMVNSLGVLGWGVGGIEAEAAMLGEASYAPIPEVVGVRLTGKLDPTVNATDLALAITETLRNANVVGSFVEYYGPGINNLTLADRGTLANMAPDYGATCGFFPVDDETLDYLTLTNRSEDRVDLVGAYSKANSLFYKQDEPVYSRVIDFDLTKVKTSLSGPKRPQDRVDLDQVPASFKETLTHEEGNHGFGLSQEQAEKTVTFDLNGQEITLKNGSILLAAITSCTNTSNPYVMMASGLIARNAAEKGLRRAPHVKTSFAPGSKAVTQYLIDAGLDEGMRALGFNLVGYGCTTCIGNSGDLDPVITEEVRDSDLVAVSVLSGNRNFEGRIHPVTKANYLASPPLIIAYAITGRIDFDWDNEALGQDQEGNDIFLGDLWPSDAEIRDYIKKYVTKDLYATSYENVFDDNKSWSEIEITENELYDWDPKSTYIQNPPFFEGMEMETDEVEGLENLRVLAKFGDSITTDHISPAGAIPSFYPAGQYLKENGVAFEDFNSYGSRRGNHQVMMRGTLGNIRLRNQIAGGKEGSYTTYWPTGEVDFIYDAAMKYKADGTGLVILAGDNYGTGSSRDWAAKGVDLLNVKAVIAKSYERIHRANLVMMGVLPLQFLDGQDAETLGLTGEEIIDIEIKPETGIRDIIKVKATDTAGKMTEFDALVRFDSEADIKYYEQDGILPYVVRKKATNN